MLSEVPSLKGQEWGDIHLTAEILIVDDDPVQRRLLKANVEREGHRAYLAENGRQGLEVLKAREGTIRAVVLDLMMPEMDGAETLRRIREAHGRQVAVVVMTADVLAIHRDDGLRDALDGFLPKPILPEALREALATVLRRA